MDEGCRVDAAEIAAPFRKEISDAVKALKALGVPPLLVGFLAHGDAGARKYAEWTAKACRRDGIDFELRECKALELEDKLNEANKDKNVHGIMIYYPCFGAKPSFYGGNMDDYLRDSVAVEKDVEGLCHTYRTSLYHDVRFLKTLSGSVTSKKCLLPCTPLAIVKALEHLKLYDSSLPVGERLRGKTVTVINRSEIVGRPLSAMIANDGADVYSVDISSIYLLKRGKMIETKKDVETACRGSQVIVTGVPTKSFKLNVDWVQPGTVVVNVSHFKNVDEKELLKIPGVKYIPLIGKVTVAMLERNLIRLVENFHTPGKETKVVEAGGRIIE
uniref:Methenyltetrahydrofolate cyclohydrolase n=1 Tax=Aplanochytrium stocchinoi TaxID=215587 RepID=A0A7S3LJ10_9STRA